MEGRSLTADGSPVPFIHPPLLEDEVVDDRYLINDGSFENGDCWWGSDWDCYSDTPFDNWIIEPEHVWWGVPAYHGIYAAWLGGYYYSVPNSNSFCQIVWISEASLNFRWMGYVEEGHTGNFVHVKIDGDIVYSKEMTWREDHTIGEWQYLSISIPGLDVGGHYLCFEFEASNGASMLIDYIQDGY